jgi:ABC-type transport system involved in multi-copper enzyme maturation permease subunit
MSSKSITEKQPERDTSPGGWQPLRERAPSVLREDEPRVARLAGLVGLMFLVVGAVALLMNAYGRMGLVGPGSGSFCIVLGLGLMLFHAAADKDLQVRRMYGTFGFLLLAAGGLLAVIPGKDLPTGFLFLPYGFLCLMVALPFLLAFAHNESDETWHQRTTLLLGGVGGVLALVGFIGGNVSEQFLLSYGLLLALAGLGYLWAFVGLRGTSDDRGHRVGVATGALGALAFVVALGRSALPPLFHSWGWLKELPTPYLVPGGLLLMALGGLYAIVAAGLCTDNRILVMTRREMAAFFFSPIAYIMLFGFTAISWFQDFSFLETIFEASGPGGGGQPLVEPIVAYYIIHWWPLISMMFIAPVLTMRLLSDERRTGSLEVMLTAPVDEVSIVLSKFLASFVFFLAVCMPWGLYLVALRIQGGQPFDYRPLLSFFVALATTGAGLLAMGLFFSSLTRNQIVAAIMTFAGTLVWTMPFFFKRYMTPDSALFNILSYVSYLDFWIEAVQGTLSPRFIVLHVSFAIFWLFLTVKVLEARKWA